MAGTKYGPIDKRVAESTIVCAINAMFDDMVHLAKRAGATHRCKECQAFWAKTFDGWRLVSAASVMGKCCDNVDMGAQIEPIFSGGSVVTNPTCGSPLRVGGGVTHFCTKDADHDDLHGNSQFEWRLPADRDNAGVK